MAEERVGYIIGIAFDPATELADWYSLWYWDAAGNSRVVTEDRRIVWVGSVAEARRLVGLLPEGYEARGELESVCDVPWSMELVAAGEPGNEGVVLLCIDLLDDMLLSMERVPPLAAPGKEVLDRIARPLCMGDPLPDAVPAAGGADAVNEQILASVGRVVVGSTFRR